MMMMTPEYIADDIISLAKFVKSDENCVCVGLNNQY